MSEQAQAILDAAMKLPAGERASLVNRLLRSLDDEPLTEREAEALDARWTPELRRRIAAIDSGQVQCIPWDSIDAQMRKLIGEKR